ncbi:MAG: hypothetical protein RMN25_12500, partial [Anaerolineae bacterium]|nr:hypothetical protein [Thermoflexales bacterium]MDW8408591.1 hypothetical protein [Anaerolineae bacterium]
MPLFDLAPFARLRRADRSTDQRHLSEIEFEWEEPRDIQRIEAVFASQPPDPSCLNVEYWQRNWPQVDPESLDGTRRGWIGQDDPFHGQWVVGRGVGQTQANTLIWEFDPLDALELPAMRDLEQRPGYRARYRRTLKLRVTFAASSPMPDVLRVSAYSEARETSFDVLVRGVQAGCVLPTQATAYNGRIANLASSADSLRVRGVGTDAPSGSRDCTLLTFRFPTSPTTTEGEGFTVNLSDLRTGPIWVRDLGMYVTEAANDVPFEVWRVRCESAPRRPIYERVTEEPEQTYDRAKAEIPVLDVARHPPYGFYAPLSLEANPQKFAVRYTGEVFTGKGLAKLNNRALARVCWPGPEIHWRIGSGDPPDFRERNGVHHQWPEEGWLPIIHTAWRDRDIAYEQVACVTVARAEQMEQLTRMPPGADSLSDSVLIMTVMARNSTTSARRACVWLHIAPDEHLSMDERGFVVAQGRLHHAQYSPAMAKVMPYESPVLRAVLRADTGCFHARVVGSISAAYPNAMLFEHWLQPGETVTLDVCIPFVSYGDPADWEHVAQLDAQRARTVMAEYWRSRMARGGSLHLPPAERDVEDFARAVPTHISISAVRDSVTGHLIVPAGTFVYGACGNEGAWQTVALDCWGHHKQARAYLESLMAVQGAIRPDGDFQSAEGALQAVDFDQGKIKPTHFYYNLDHGVILQAILFHYRITGDQEWLRRFASNIVAACQFIIRERSATAGRDARTRGLLPPGHLEDNPEWRYWFAVNAHAYGGMKMAADALSEIDHPAASRIQAAAAAYRSDIVSAVREARMASPVVRLLNGVAVPHIPTRAELRGREFGWIREVAYGATQLWDGGLFEHHAPELTWMLQDLEDNGFIN